MPQLLKEEPLYTYIHTAPLHKHIQRGRTISVLLRLVTCRCVHWHSIPSYDPLLMSLVISTSISVDEETDSKNTRWDVTILCASTSKSSWTVSLVKFGESVVYLWFLGCFGLSHYTPSPKAASDSVINPTLASHSQLVIGVAFLNWMLPWCVNSARGDFIS